jgi:hypothetical protein
VDFNRPDVVLIDRIKSALVIDTAIPLTHNLPKIEAQKITKYETSPSSLKMPGSLIV